MKNAISILLMIVALCLAAWALALGIAVVTGAVLFSRALDSLADLVSMPGCVKSMVFWTFLAPFSILASRMFAPFRKVRIRAILFMASVLGMYWTITYVVNQQRFFDPRTGKPVKWVDGEPNGPAKYFPSPGVNPDTGHVLVPVTPSLLQKLQIADPETATWFWPATGKPALYYVHDGTNGLWHFFKAEPGMFDPNTGRALEPVTPPVRTEWERDMSAQREAAAQAQLQRQSDKEQSLVDKGVCLDAEAEELATQKKQQDEVQEQLANAKREEQERIAKFQEQVTALNALLESNKQEVVQLGEEENKRKQRIADAQRQYDEILKETEQKVASEQAARAAAAKDEVRQSNQESVVPGRAVAEVDSTDEVVSQAETPKTVMQTAPMPVYNVTSWSPVVYARPTRYSAAPVTYYYRAPVRSYYVAAPRPRCIVQWAYPQRPSIQPYPAYRYAPAFTPAYRQGRRGR